MPKKRKCWSKHGLFGFSKGYDPRKYRQIQAKTQIGNDSDLDDTCPGTFRLPPDMTSDILESSPSVARILRSTSHKSRVDKQIESTIPDADCYRVLHLKKVS